MGLFLICFNPVLIWKPTMQRTKAGFGIILLILGAILFAGFVDEQLSAKSGSEAEISTPSE